MSVKYHVYGLGNALVDTEIEVADQLIQELNIKKGHMTLIDEQRLMELSQGLHGVRHKRACGGSAANTVIAVRQMGGRCFYSCRVANDETGKFYLEDLLANGVQTNLDGQKPTGTTGRCLVLITPDAERTMETYLGVTANFSKEDIVAEALKNSEYVYIEGYLVAQEKGPEAMLYAKQLALENGVKTSISLSDPSMVEYFGDSLRKVIGPGVDLLFCNETEALGFTKASHILEAKEALKKVASSFVITLGSKGALVYDGQNSFDIPAHQVKAVDTNGAGDMFAGAFLYGITHGKSFLEAGHLAGRAAARVVSQFGPRLTTNEAQQVLIQQF